MIRAPLRLYQAQYGDRPEFEINRDARQITWKDAEYSVTMAFYEGGRRGVLQIGWDWVA